MFQDAKGPALNLGTPTHISGAAEGDLFVGVEFSSSCDPFTRRLFGPASDIDRH